MNDLSVSLSSIPLKNPLILASGALGSSYASLEACVKAGVGAVTTKSIILNSDTRQLLPQSEVIIEAINQLGDTYDTPIIANIVAYHADEYAKLAETVSTTNANMMEVYINVPQVYQPDQVELITSKVVQNTDLPVSIKLSPLGWNIQLLVEAAIAGGATVVTAITGLPGASVGQNNQLQTDFKSYLNGPELKHVALQTVGEIYKSYPEMPIIGTGGVSRATDVLEMLNAGATAVGIGTKAFQDGPHTFVKLLEEITQQLKDNECTTIKELCGSAV